MGKYKSYEQAYAKGREDVWPGCGRIGLCMSCGSVHNFDYKVGNFWSSNYCCSENYRNGCPNPKPEPKHEWSNQGKCKKCGEWRGWKAPDGKRYRTVEHAKANGWKRGSLIRSEK